MSWPVNLVIIRHGESDWNVAYAADRETGDGDLLHAIAATGNPEGASLTQRGCEQARQAGQWLRSQERLSRFDRFLSSPYPRACQTAECLGYTRAWEVVSNLRERSWGALLCVSRSDIGYEPAFAGRQEDPVNWRALGGESMAEALSRARRFLSAVRFDCSFSVICVTHGELILALRSVVEGWTDERFAQEVASRANQYSVHNGHVLWYSRQDPASGAIVDSFQWLYSICPWNSSSSPNVWVRLPR